MRRILAVKLSSMGDIVLMTPCLRALREAFPDARIHLAVESRWADLVRWNPCIDGLIECSSEVRLSPGYLLYAYRRLRAAGPFDLALDFQGTRRSAAWVYLSRAGIQAGRGHPRPGWRTSSRMDYNRHAVLLCADVCRSIGIPVHAPKPEIHMDPANAAEGLPHDDYMVLNPFSGWITKDVPIGLAEGLAGRVSRELGLRVIVNGSPNQADRAESIARIAGPEVVSLAGRLSLGQALCLFQNARLMVSCDSGPMHAAAALGVPVVALFGPTHPEHTGPWGEGHRVLQASRPAQHQAYRFEDAMRHMAALDADRVFEAVRDMVEKRVPVAPR